MTTEPTRTVLVDSRVTDTCLIVTITEPSSGAEVVTVVDNDAPYAIVAALTRIVLNELSELDSGVFDE